VAREEWDAPLFVGELMSTVRETIVVGDFTGGVQATYSQVKGKAVKVSKR
jgi:hypothetical protein